MKKILLLLFNHERYQTISIVVVTGLLVWLYGCQPKTVSLITPTKKVTKLQLQAELDFLLARAEQGFATISQQEQLRNFVFQQALITAQTGTINPIALLTSAGAILGLGGVVDNVRKRKIIKKLENGKSTPP